MESPYSVPPVLSSELKPDQRLDAFLIITEKVAEMAMFCPWVTQEVTLSFEIQVRHDNGEKWRLSNQLQNQIGKFGTRL